MAAAQEAMCASLFALVNTGILCLPSTTLSAFFPGPEPEVPARLYAASGALLEAWNVLHNDWWYMALSDA